MPLKHSKYLTQNLYKYLNSESTTQLKVRRSSAELNCELNPILPEKCQRGFAKTTQPCSSL